MDASHQPTLADVARRAGVSKATASRALGPSRDRVSPELAARVMQAARELHYVPNAHAQALARASSSTVGLIVHDVSDPYFSEIARGVLRATSDHDLLAMICNSYRDPDRELSYIASLRAQRVHAILMAGSGYTDPVAEAQLSAELAAFQAAGGRVALIGRHHAVMDAVLPDNVGGASLAARHLLELGHRRIAVIAGPTTLTTVEDRLAGFCGQLAEAGIELPASCIVHHPSFTRAGGYEGTKALLAAHPDTTAVFALNDTMAVGALAALRASGRAVPEEVSVIGFDDIPLAQDVTPTLTTIRIDMAGMGEQAVELALSSGDVPRTVPMQTQLVVRESTASAPR